MRYWLATTSLGTLAALAAAQPAIAETSITTAVTTPVATGTAGDSIRITSTGSVKVGSGTAVTVNSSHGVRNDGTIAIQGANNSTGILANPGLTANINNTGTITIDENYTPTDSDSDGDLDGLFAQGSNRFGIRVAGPGVFTGTITNSGTIAIEGNQSGGIVVDSALAGSIANSGSINVLGNDSVGIRAGDVSGNVTLSKGGITVQGANSVGVSLTGDIGGALVIQNSVSSTGYRSTTPPADTSKLDSDDLLQGGSAVVIEGNVAGGILFDARPADKSTTDTDEDDDGVPDAEESTATITSLGSAAAVRIGSATDNIGIGAVAGSGGKGLVVKGLIGGNGVYKGVAGNGLVIGGLGGTVDIAGGLTVNGSITGKAVEANATAIRIGSGATVPVIEVTGQVAAEGAGTASTAANAIVIDAGASVTTIRNSGTISARRTGTEGTATAIFDKAGTVTLIENKGAIQALGSSDLGDKGIAIDLRANSSGATVRQLAVAATENAPAIRGSVLFGSGNDVFEVADGAVAGTVDFGIGDNRLTATGDSALTGAVKFAGGADQLQLGGTSSLIGNVDFGGGADVMTLSGTALYRGSLSGSAGTSITVGAGSSLQLTNSGAVAMQSLTTGAGSSIGVTLSGNGASTLYDIAGAASFGTGTTVNVNVLTLGGIAGTYKIIEAGTLTGAGNLSTGGNSLPFLFGSNLVTGTPGEVSLVIHVKTAEELGLNSSEGSVLAAVLGAADSDAPIARVFLGASTSEGLRSSLQQMLPEHAGGAFENATRGSRLTASILNSPRDTNQEGLNLWAQQVAWGAAKSIGSTSSYDLSGWGAAGGVERSIGGIGSLGLSLAYLVGNDEDDNVGRSLIANEFEGGAYWRGSFGPLNAFIRGTAGLLSFDGSRTFSAVVNGEQVTRKSEGDWSGRLYSASAGVAYDLRMGRLSLRPSLGVEHYTLTEKAYTESGGGEAFDLTIRKRTSDESAGTAMLALGYDLLGIEPGKPWLRVELEGGRREIFSGSLGSTVASYGDGTPFTLVPEERTSGWRAALRVNGGGGGILLSGEIGGEEQQGHASIGARVGMKLGF